MDSDISWYENSQTTFKNQPSGSGTQLGRPPDITKDEKPDTKNFVEAVCLVEEEDDPEEAVNSFHDLTRRKILLPFTGIDIQDEFKFVEAIRQFKMSLEEKVEVITLRRNLKEILFKYLLFFGTNYGRVAVLYKDQYLDAMEDVLLFYCDVIREHFRDQKRINKKIKMIKEARRIKILFRECLLNKMDRILHVLLKVRMAPEIEEYRFLWGDVYMYFLTKVRNKRTDDDILRGFIAFQKFKTIRAESEAVIIDKLMMETYKKSVAELKRIPCLGEIMDRMKRDRLYTVRDMVTMYMRYYKEKRSKNERFDLEDSDADSDDVNTCRMQQLDLSNSFPSIPSTFSSGSQASQVFAERRQGIRKTVLDLADESDNYIFPADQYSDEFAEFNEDVTKREAPDDPVVILDDEEDDDDVIIVCDNLKSVITIDDDEEEPVQIQPTRSSRVRLPPNRSIRPSKARFTNSTTQLVETTSRNRVEEILMSSPNSVLTPEGSPRMCPEVDNTSSTKSISIQAGSPSRSAEVVNIPSPKSILPPEGSPCRSAEVDNTSSPKGILIPEGSPPRSPEVVNTSLPKSILTPEGSPPRSAEAVNTSLPKSILTPEGSPPRLAEVDNTSSKTVLTSEASPPRSAEVDNTSSAKSILTPEGSPPRTAEVDTELSCSESMDVEKTVLEEMLPPEQPSSPARSPVPSSLLSRPEILVPEQVVASQTKLVTRQVKAIDNSLKITFRSLPQKLSTVVSECKKIPTSELQGNKPIETLKLPPSESMEVLPNLNEQAKEILPKQNSVSRQSVLENTLPPSDPDSAQISSLLKAPEPPSLTEKVVELSRPNQDMVSNLSVSEKELPSNKPTDSQIYPPKISSVPPSLKPKLMSSLSVSAKELPSNEPVDPQVCLPEIPPHLNQNMEESLPKQHMMNDVSVTEKSTEPVEYVTPPLETVFLPLNLDDKIRENSGAHSGSQTELPSYQLMGAEALLLKQNVMSDTSSSEGKATDPSMDIDLFGSETSIDESVEKETLDQTGGNESAMDVAAMLGDVANSTMNEDTESLMEKTSISPIIKENMLNYGTKSERLEYNTSSSNKGSNLPLVRERIGVLPSSKIPDNLDDSEDHVPSKDKDKFDLPERPRTISEISSPPFESIDRTDAKMYFNNKEQEVGVSSSSTSETSTSDQTSNSTSASVKIISSSSASEKETSTSTKTGDSTSASFSEASFPVSPESAGCADSKLNLESHTSRRESDASSADESNENIWESTADHVESDDPKESSPLTQESTQLHVLEAESIDLSQRASRKLNKPSNYSNLTECFTKFGEELSVEDILTTLPEEGEESIASSKKPIALLVTFPGSSQEENQHFLMCGTNLAISDENLAFTSDEKTPLNNDFSYNSDASIKALPDTALPPRRDTVDSSLSLSGSQPYTPQSSPSTRVEAIRIDIKRLEESVSSLYPCLKDSEAASQQTLSSQCKRPPTIEAKDLSDEKGSQKSSEVVGKVCESMNKVTKRRKSTENSFKTSMSVKSRRRSSELPRVETCQPAKKSGTPNSGSIVRPPEIAAVDFREDLSHSLTSAKGVTPQEVVKISQLPFKYSEPLWSDKSLQKAEVSQTDLFDSHFGAEKPVQGKLSGQNTQQKINVLQQKSNVSQQNSNASHSKPSVGLVDSPERQMSNLTRSASLFEKSFDELYLKEFGNNLLQQDNQISGPRIQSKRRDSQERSYGEALSPARSVKIYAKDKPVKDVSESKDRDTSLKSYKTLIKGMSRRRSSTSQKDEGISQPPYNPSQQPKDSILQASQSRNKNASGENSIYDHSELFNNELDGPISKPIARTHSEENFLWDNDVDSAKPDENNVNDNSTGIISVKPDSQLYRETKGSDPKEAVVKKPTQDTLVSRLKSSRKKRDDKTSEHRSPEKKKVTFSNKNDIREIIPVFDKELCGENEAIAPQEKQPNYFDYSFNNFLASQSNLNIPLQSNLTFPEIASSYYPHLNFPYQNSAYFSNDSMQSQNNLFVPPDNLEINPNLLHSEKNVPECPNNEEFGAISRSLEESNNILNQNYVFDNTNDIPYFGLSNALGGSVHSTSYDNSIMFKDNPFIGQNRANTRTPVTTLSPIQPGNCIYDVQNYGIPLGTGNPTALALSQAQNSPVDKDNRLLSAANKAKAVQSRGNVYVAQDAENIAPNPERFHTGQPSAQMYSEMALNYQNNLYCGQNSVRLPDISTLKDPRRKNHTNFAQGHEIDGSPVPLVTNNGNFIPSIDMMPQTNQTTYPSDAQSHSDPFPVMNRDVSQTTGIFQSYGPQPEPPYRHNLEDLSQMISSTEVQSETVPRTVQPASNVSLPPEIYQESNKTFQSPKLEESNTTETLQESLQKAQLPPKKRKLTEDEELAIYIQKFKEEKERKKKLEENISYPAQRQMSIADLQRDFPKVKTLAARKLYPEGTAYPEQNYYEYPQGYDQYNDYNDYGNKRSIMNVYINGVRKCSANYPLCLMIGTVHTCVNNQSNNASENNQHPEATNQVRPPSEVPQHEELTSTAQNLQKTLAEDVTTPQIVEVPQARPKRSRKAGNCAGEAPPAKRGRGRPRKNVNYGRCGRF